MMVSFSMKRQPPWAAFGSNMWSATYSHQDMGFEDGPWSPARRTYIEATLRWALAMEVAGNLAHQGVISPDEAKSQILPFYNTKKVLDEKGEGTKPDGVEK